MEQKDMYKVINLQSNNDDRGSLVVFQEAENVPFAVKRTYFIYGMNPKSERGGHSHKNLEQMIICLNGSCDFILNDGKTENVIHLDSPNKGLYIKDNIWREFKNFSENTIIAVIASELYDEDDYIRDFQEFLKSKNVSND